MLARSLFISVLFASAASLASAASVTVTDLRANPQAYANWLATAGSTITEDFETAGAAMGGSSGAELPGALSTAVGQFSTIGGTGTGGTVKKAGFANTGQGLGLRRGNVYGRTNDTPGGAWFLDSNDTKGMAWSVQPGDSFRQIAFTLSDISDVGAKFYLEVNGSVLWSSLSRLRDGAKRFFVIDFGSVMSDADDVHIVFRNDRRNDGFSIDNVSVATTPLPPAMLLLLAGLGGLAVMKRRQTS